MNSLTDSPSAVIPVSKPRKPRLSVLGARLFHDIAYYARRHLTPGESLEGIAQKFMEDLCHPGNADVQELVRAGILNENVTTHSSMPESRINGVLCVHYLCVHYRVNWMLTAYARAVLLAYHTPAWDHTPAWNHLCPSTS